MIMIGKGWRQFGGDHRFGRRCGGDALGFQTHATAEEIKALAEDRESRRGTHGGIQARPEPLPELGANVDRYAADSEGRLRDATARLKFPQLHHAHITAGLLERPEPVVAVADLS